MTEYSKENADYIEAIKKRLAKIQHTQPWQLYYRGHDRYDLGLDTCAGGDGKECPEATAWDEDVANFMVYAPADVEWLIRNLEASESMREDMARVARQPVFSAPTGFDLSDFEAEVICEALAAYKKATQSKMIEKVCSKLYKDLRDTYGYFAG